MSRSRFPVLAAASLAAIALLAGAPLGGCSGSSSADCSVPATNRWVLQAAQANYLFVDDIPAGLDPAAYPTTRELLDKVMEKAPASADPELFRRFSYMSTRAQVSQTFDEGTSQGFGIGLRYVGATQLFVTYVLGGSPAERGGFARGDELLAVAGSADQLGAPENQIAALLADPTGEALSTALGSRVLGQTRVFRVLRADRLTSADLTATIALFSLDPVPAPLVLDAGGRRVGYLALRTFINPALPLLDAAFTTLAAQGVTDLIVDLRYNGGGYLHVASALLDLLAAGQGAGAAKFSTRHNARRTGADQGYAFAAPDLPNAFRPGAAGRIAFIVTGASASASELVPWALLPYLGPNVALIGEATLGKPAGQEGYAAQACQDVLWLLTFQLANRDAPAAYWSGLPDPAFAASGSSCAAADDLTHPLGDAAEASTAAALQWIAQGTCPAGPIPTTGAPAALARRAGTPGAPPLAVEPSFVQRHLAGLH